MKKRGKIVLRTPIIKPVLYEDGDFDVLKSAWNKLPEDLTSEERMIFIEFIEKAIKSYNLWKRLTDKEEASRKN